MVRREHFEAVESALTLIGEDLALPYAKEAVLNARSSIEAAIARDPYFATSFEPLACIGGDRVIRRMCDAAAKADVGPMAAVAGTIAWEAVDAMVAAGSATAVADNGGDIAIVCDRPMTIGVHTGGALQGIGLRIEPRTTVLGVCSSSARVGPSISLGSSDICTVVSEDVSLADACATALGNMVKDDDETSLRDCLQRIVSIDGVIGAMVSIGGKVAIAGDMPRLVRAEPREELITRRILNR